MKAVDVWDKALDEQMKVMKEEIMKKLRSMSSEEAEKIKSIQTDCKFVTEEEIEREFKAVELFQTEVLGHGTS